MSTLLQHQRSISATGFSGFVRRHPMAAFLAMAHAGLWGSFLPVLFLGAPPRLLSAVGALTGLAVPSFVVTYLVGGRAGVRDLMRRSLRWRVRVRFFVFAVLAVPLAAALLAPLMLGPSAVSGLLAGGWPVAGWFVLDMLVALATVQLFEEIGWAGFAQHTLQSRHGAMRASLLIAPAFATVHIPMYFIGAPMTAHQMVTVLSMMALVIPVSLFFRVLVAWTYNRTAASVLLAAVLHASFNAASGGEFLERFGSGPTASMLPLVAMVSLAVVVAVATKGRLGYERPARR